MGLDIDILRTVQTHSEDKMPQCDWTEKLCSVTEDVKLCSMREDVC